MPAADEVGESLDELDLSSGVFVGWFNCREGK